MTPPDQERPQTGFETLMRALGLTILVTFMSIGVGIALGFMLVALVWVWELIL